MSLDVGMEPESIRQVPGAGLDGLRIPGDNAEKVEFVERMATIRAKATEIANQAWELINDIPWQVIKDDYGQPERYSQTYNGEMLVSDQEPITISFGKYSSDVVYLAIEIDYLGLADDGIIGASAWAHPITEDEQALLIEA